MQFGTFFRSCFKCNKFGHFAKECQGSHANLKHDQTSMNSDPHVVGEGKEPNVKETQATKSAISKLKGSDISWDEKVKITNAKSKGEKRDENITMVPEASHPLRKKKGHGN